MPLRYAILHPETLQSFMLAADERYFDATELLVLGRTTGAVYLVGYVAEMLLKHAALRLGNVRPGDEVGALMGPAMKWARRLLPTIDPEGKHSLWFWAHFVRRKRREQGRALDHRIDAELVRRMRRLHGNWMFNLRYCDVAASAVEAKTAFEDVSWLRKHNASLWR
jgi:hypothetical protein